MNLINYIINNYLNNPQSFFYYQDPYFLSWFGFTSAIIIVVLAKIVGIIVRRDENYYQDE